jgi:hypothetical protein
MIETSASTSNRPPLRPQRPAHDRHGPPHHGECRPQQDAAQAGDGAQVQRVGLRDRPVAEPPVRIGRHVRLGDRSRVVQQCDRNGDRDRGDEQPTTHGRDLAGAVATEQEDHHDRPEDVELLFDGEAPEVPERGEVAGGGVAEALPDLVPVGHVEEPGEDVAAQRSECVVPEDRRPHRDEEHHGEQRGEQTPRTAQPEVAQRDPVGAFAFGDQQQRDQVPGDHEEHLDAEEAARKPVGVGVVHHHRHDGERAHPVEARQVRDTTDVDAVVRRRFHPGRGERGHG